MINKRKMWQTEISKKKTNVLTLPLIQNKANFDKFWNTFLVDCFEDCVSLRLSVYLKDFPQNNLKSIS